MSTTEPTEERTRLEHPAWVSTKPHQFRMDLSWTDSSARWLECTPDAEIYARHSWRLVLREAVGEPGHTALTVTGTEVLCEKVLANDVLDLLARVQLDPHAYDRSPA